MIQKFTDLLIIKNNNFPYLFGLRINNQKYISDL